jgi:hypothetical protein
MHIGAPRADVEDDAPMSATYRQSFSYDALNRLANAPGGFANAGITSRIPNQGGGGGGGGNKGNAGNEGGGSGRRAQGGMASGLTLVGEQGPELAVFPPGTNIIPAGQTRAMLSSGGGMGGYGGYGGGGGIPSGPINIYIGGTRVAQVLWPELVAAARQHGGIRQ